MTPNNQEDQTSKKNRYLILGLLAVCVLVGVVTIWLQRTSLDSPIGSSATATLRINLPTTDYPTIPASAPEFTVPIVSVGASGITGTVTFKDIAGTVAILLQVDGMPEDEESEESIVPAELRYGTCTALGALAYPMSPPDAGASETDLSINLKEFNTQKPMAVVLYRSLQDHTVIACGDVS
jgi:hypothetical protein